MLETLLLIIIQTTLIKNPRTIEWECPDHTLDTGHEVDIVDEKSVVIQTIQAGDPPSTGTANGNPLVRYSVNVQPVAFGNYTFRVRALAGLISSDPSLPSPVWQRAPGQPGNVRPGQ